MRIGKNIVDKDLLCSRCRIEACLLNCTILNLCQSCRTTVIKTYAPTTMKIEELKAVIEDPVEGVVTYGFLDEDMAGRIKSNYEYLHDFDTVTKRAAKMRDLERSNNTDYSIVFMQRYKTIARFTPKEILEFSLGL